MKTILYPGSFDPFTNGHLDLVVRAGLLFDRVIVAVAVNSGKTPLFTLQERKALIEEACADQPHVTVVAFEGLVVDAVKEFHADAILRGLRAFSDFEYELQMALTNRNLNEKCETIFMTPKLQNSHVASHLVKEIAFLNGDYAMFVPPCVHAAIERKKKERRS